MALQRLLAQEQAKNAELQAELESERSKSASAELQGHSLEKPHTYVYA